MPGSSQRAATTSTGSRMELVRLLDSDDEKLVDDLLGWQYAAIARVLAEAGAIHPAVHTPARVTNYLERNGWKRVPDPRNDMGPQFVRWVCDRGIELDAPVSGDVPDYTDYAGVVRVAVKEVPNV